MRLGPGLGRGGDAAAGPVYSVRTVPTACTASSAATATATPTKGAASPLSRSRQVHIGRGMMPETFAPRQQEVFWEELATRHGLLQLALFLRDAHGGRPAAFTLRNPRCDLFGRIKPHVRAQDGNGLPVCARVSRAQRPRLAGEPFFLTGYGRGRTPSSLGQRPNPIGACGCAILVDKSDDGPSCVVAQSLRNR